MQQSAYTLQVISWAILEFGFPIPNYIKKNGYRMETLSVKKFRPKNELALMKYITDKFLVEQVAKS